MSETAERAAHEVAGGEELAEVLDGRRSWAVLQGDADQVLRRLPAACCHSAIIDPPGGGGHLAQEWDDDRGGRDQWIAWMTRILTRVNRALLPGAYVACWCWRTTSDWTGRALENAGFRKVVLSCNNHGQGVYAGDVDVAKAVESLILFGSPHNKNWRKLAGLRRDGAPIALDQLGVRAGYRAAAVQHSGAFDLDPQTPEGREWMGWHTIVPTTGDLWWLAQKPIAEETIAAQVLATGTGALNTDAASRWTDDTWPGNVWRFPKATVEEKEAGCERLAPMVSEVANPGGIRDHEERWSGKARRNSHPTVKSMNLIEFLVELTTKPGGLVLDCFAGSGTTGCACRRRRRWRFVGVELSERHCQEARARIEHWDRAFRETVGGVAKVRGTGQLLLPLGA